MKIDIFVIDFDSTFVDGESVNMMIEIALKDYARRKEIYGKLNVLSDLCMKSEISFKDNFKMKIEIVKQALKEEHLLKVAEILKDKVSPDILKIVNKAKELNKKIIVVGNGFKIIMKDIMKKYDIEIYFANKHETDKNGFVIGFDETNPMANDNGKENVIKFLRNVNIIQPDEKIMMIGDGMSDFMVYKNHTADYFLNFAVNENRKLKKHRIADDPNFIICRKSAEIDEFITTIE